MRQGRRAIDIGGNAGRAGGTRAERARLEGLAALSARGDLTAPGRRQVLLACFPSDSQVGFHISCKEFYFFFHGPEHVIFHWTVVH